MKPLLSPLSRPRIPLPLKVDSRIVAYFILALTPWIAFISLLIGAGGSIDRLLPVGAAFIEFNDGLYYWHQSVTFAHAGFQGGYYTAGEVPALVSSIGFYSWGTTIPVLYGTVGALFGTPYYLIPLVNVAALSLAIIYFIIIVRPDFIQCLLLCAVLLTNGMLWSFLLVSQALILNLAIAIVFAALFWKLLSQTGIGATSFRLQLVIVTTIASLILPLWSVLWIPILGLFYRNNRFQTLIAMGGGAIIAGIFFLFYQLTSAPFPNASAQILEGFKVSISEGWNAYIGVVETNLKAIVDSTQLRFRLNVLNSLRLQVLTIVALVPVYWIFRNKKMRGILQSLCLEKKEIIFHFFNIGSAAFLIISLHYTGYTPEMRAIAPRLLLSVVLLIAMRRYIIAGIFIVLGFSSILLLVTILHTTVDTHLDAESLAEIRQFSAIFPSVIQYDANATSKWCNTLLISAEYLYRETDVVVAVPAGIGLSHMFPPAGGIITPPFKSRYLLLDWDYLAEQPPNPQWRMLLELSSGRLYQNLDSECAGES